MATVSWMHSYFFFFSLYISVRCLTFSMRLSLSYDWKYHILLLTNTDGLTISHNRSLLNIDIDYEHFVSLFLSFIAYLIRALIGLTIQWLNDGDDVQYNKEIIICKYRVSLTWVEHFQCKKSIDCHNIVQWALLYLMHIAHSGSKKHFSNHSID